tara:strand:- start:20 stop:217 length:198 start_codon:yes stop_codon:yes gene_type:complete
LKWFPFGFGTATGTNFVIEEIVEVSDDEEDYGSGSYQKERQEVKTKRVRAKVGSWLDQYQSARYP